MAGQVARQALVVHVFYYVGGLGGRLAQVQQAWDVCAELGMTEAVPGWPWHTELPEIAISSGGYRRLAARQRPGVGTHQASLALTRDVVVLTVLLASQEATSWRELEEVWPHELPGNLGAVRVLLGVSVGDLFAPAGGPTVQVRPDVENTAPGSWETRAQRTGQGFAVWEVPYGDTPLCRRRLVALAPPALERDLDGWAWHGRDWMAPLTRYLLHAARLRHQAEVLRDSRHLELHERVVEVTERIAACCASLRGRGATAVSEALEARGALIGLRGDQEGLIAAVARLRMMRQTVQIESDTVSDLAASGLRLVSTETDSGGLLGEDQGLGVWLLHRIDDDLEYLNAALEASAEVSREAVAVVEAHLAEHRQHLALVQTSLIGALLMALTAVQGFGYQVHLPGAWKAPIIALLSCLALALPITVPGWSRSTVRQRPLPAYTHTVVLLLGASLGWTAAALAAGAVHHGPAPAAWSIAAAAAGAATTALAQALIRRQRQGQEEPPVFRRRSRRSRSQ
ncbi:CATRA conflict system CASPASE/TPR repeat-associated protein [Streptomyces mirabilis]|uniref:CATRA conflict system CASPASE/TPR repeat-associated protein n=1 Tax=Streptomyces mirabilis TaxID=68239 RepID=UPI0036D07496